MEAVGEKAWSQETKGAEDGQEDDEEEVVVRLDGFGQSIAQGTAVGGGVGGAGKCVVVGHCGWSAVEGLG